MDGTSYILKSVSPEKSLVYQTNSLEHEHALGQLLSQHPDIPQPKAIALDTSTSIVPFPYLLLSHPQGIPLFLARSSGKLTQRQTTLLDLRLGQLYKSIHDKVQNDWFGLPSQASDELYSWQEAFTWQLEGLLNELHESGEDIPYEDIRRYLSRAIGFFLFDDCEVPSLISFLGDETTVFIDFDLDSPSSQDEIPITSIYSLSHALWGDPLLETMFFNPSAAFLEGYGENLTIFARQKTKRIWYTLFLALVIIVQNKRSESANLGHADKVRWARETLQKCTTELKDAPCY